IIFPFIIGFAAAWFFYKQIFASGANQLISSMFFGTALSITALSVITKILMDLNILKTKIGNLVLTSAMIDDFLGWVLFSAILQMMNSGKGTGSFWPVIMVVVFAVLLKLLVRGGITKLFFMPKKYLKIGRFITRAISFCFPGPIAT